MSSLRAKRSNQPAGASGGTLPQWRRRARQARFAAAQYNRIDFRSRRFFAARGGVSAHSSGEAGQGAVEPAGPRSARGMPPAPGQCICNQIALVWCVNNIYRTTLVHAAVRSEGE